MFDDYSQPIDHIQCFVRSIAYADRSEQLICCGENIDLRPIALSAEAYSMWLQLRSSHQMAGWFADKDVIVEVRSEQVAAVHMDATCRSVRARMGIGGGLRLGDGIDLCI